MYVWMSYKDKSQLVDAPVYAASVKLKVYTLASPILVPNPPNLEYNPTAYLCAGAPDTLLTLKLFPISKGMFTFDTDWVFLGFSTSKIVVEIFSTSYPLTYAFPGDTFTHIKSSEGVFPWSVFSVLKNRPLFNELCTDGLNGSTA